MKINWLEGAKSIMTTDTVPKFYSRKIKLNSMNATISWYL